MLSLKCRIIFLTAMLFQSSIVLSSVPLSIDEFEIKSAKYLNERNYLEITRLHEEIKRSESNAFDTYSFKLMSAVIESYSGLAKFDLALTYAFRMKSNVEIENGIKSREYALSLNAIGLIHKEMGDYISSIDYLTGAVSIFKSLDNQVDLLTALNNIGLGFVELGRYDEAIEVQEKVLSIIGDADYVLELELAVALNNKGVTLLHLNKYDDALKLFVKASEIRSKLLGLSNPEYATTLGNIGAALWGLGDYKGALSQYYKVLEVRRNGSLSVNNYLHRTLINISALHIRIGEYSKPFAYLYEAISISTKFYGDDHPETAIALQHLASLYANISQHEKALELELKALKIYINYYDGDHPRVVGAYNNVGNRYFSVGNKVLAQEYILKYLEMSRRIFGESDHNYAIALNSSAQILFDYNLYDEALDYYLKANDIWIANYGNYHSHVSTVLNNIGFLYLNKDDYDNALIYFYKSYSVNRVIYHDSHPKLATNLLWMAFIKYRMGALNESILLYKKSVNIYQLIRGDVSLIGSSDLAIYTRSVALIYQTLANILIEEGRLAEAQQVLDMLKEDELFEFIRRSSDADPRRTRIGFTPEETRWASGYKEVSGRLAALGAEQRELQQKAKRGLSAAEKARAEAIKAELAVAEKAFTAFLSDMQRTLKAQGPAKVDEVAATSLASQRELQSLIRDLGPGVVLLQYYVTNNKVGMILTTPDVVIPFSTEIDSRTLNRQVFQLRNALRDPRSNVLGPAQELYRLLLAPVVSALEQSGAKTVMLSLDGQLRHLPFGALHDGKQFAAQRWSLPIYTAVTRDRLREGGAQRWTAAGLGVTRAIGEFKALPAVRAEMDNLLRATGTRTAQSVVYLDERFTAQRLKEVGQRDFQLMHISSHFSISPGTEANSFLLLGDGQRLTLGDIRTQNFRFDNVDLLTLAACDTGVGGGRDSTGKEIEGLGVIAQQQGAKAVLATLWPVADGSTAKLMTDMYQRHQTQGLSKIEALRQAQLAMMSQPKYAHPFYWAPFILLGNWQ